jgi:hypothetical protein
MREIDLCGNERDDDATMSASRIKNAASDEYPIGPGNSESRT